MSQIIIGVNESDEALDALRLGRELALDEGADVIVVSVFAPGLADTPRIYQRGRSAYVAEMSDRATRELGEGGFRHLTPAAETPAGALQHVAEDEDADLVVIGSTHRGPVGRVLPGSVGDRLLNGAPSAVAVAPRGYARREHPRIGLVGVAYNGTAESERALEEACRIALRRGAALEVITVAPAFIEPPGPLGAGEAIRDRFRRILDTGGASVPDGIEVEVVLEDGDAAAALANRGVELDLLVVGSRAHGPLARVLLGSTSAEVMRTAPCPVIVVPRGSRSPAGESEAGQPVTAAQTNEATTNPGTR